ncbi:hypothetical protein M407DRAFT_21047 [Tulasnella calospora MUT 4182]|uniref:Uncharacterized protein n=1 Tax=Tulasnella calospora MUT 4182 TaxID=1051891 RepID=A0A0C3L7H1_9AGAM|nr:hypothetical protein M407DRAFT_21047 [Tulasnella calospora MUT 4182]
MTIAPPQPKRMADRPHRFLEWRHVHLPHAPHPAIPASPCSRNTVATECLIFTNEAVLFGGCGGSLPGELEASLAKVGLEPEANFLENAEAPYLGMVDVSSLQKASSLLGKAPPSLFGAHLPQCSISFSGNSTHPQPPIFGQETCSMTQKPALPKLAKSLSLVALVQTTSLRVSKASWVLRSQVSAARERLTLQRLERYSYPQVAQSNGLSTHSETR